MSIFVKHTQPFTAVPNYLVNDPDVSAEALAVISYLGGKPTGWIARAYDIKKRFKWGKYKWERVSRELATLGILSHIPHSDGMQLLFELKWEKVNNPVDKPCEPWSENPTVGKPTVGKSDHIERKSSTKKDLLNKKDLLGRQLSVDNSEQLPTSSVPFAKQIFKKVERRAEKMTDQQEHARRQVLAQQFEKLTGVKAVMNGGVYVCETK